MKILHVTPHYYPATGGAETHMKEISERLARRGHDVTVLTTREAADDKGGALTDTEMINQVAVNRFRPADGLHHLFNGFLGLRGAHRLLGLAMSAGRIQMLATGPYTLRPFRESLRSKPEIVAVTNWYCGSLAYQICQARRFQHFAFVGIPLFHTERDWSRSSIYSQMLERCDAVMAATEHEKRFIDQRSSRDNAHVVGMGVDPSAFAHADGQQVRARYGIGNAPLVGYVGRMTAAKGVATLIDAMKRVWRTDPTVRLLLAGSGLPTGSNPSDEVTQALAGLSSAEDARITTIGRFADSEKASIFDALDLFAMPSIGESFGIAYLEAWTCKKPVIGSRIGSTQCVIEHGVDGVLVTPADVDELAASILRLLGDRAAREQMGRMGHSRTMAHFTWNKITDKVEHIYNQAHVAMLKQPFAESQLRGRKSPSGCL